MVNSPHSDARGQVRHGPNAVPETSKLSVAPNMTFEVLKAS